MSGFFALLDDIATLAKLTVSTLDDTAAMAVKTSAKVSAAAVDDVAATPQYVTGIAAEREIPIIKRIATLSLRNKLLIILPIGLLLTWLAPWALPVLLILGGSYLCFEGGEKVLSRWLAHEHHDAEAPRDENAIVRQATTTDFVLSTEIMLLALAEVQNSSSTQRILTLILIAFLMTFAVYGLVAALIKLDDLGLHLSRRGSRRAKAADGDDALAIAKAAGRCHAGTENGTAQQAGSASDAPLARLGRGIVRATPRLFAALGVLGTVAMLWVGGEIVAHNLAQLGLHAPEHLIEHVAHLTSQPILSWLAETATACVLGLLYGSVLTVSIVGLRRLIARFRLAQAH